MNCLSTLVADLAIRSHAKARVRGASLSGDEIWMRLEGALQPSTNCALQAEPCAAPKIIRPGEGPELESRGFAVHGTANRQGHPSGTAVPEKERLRRSPLFRSSRGICRRGIRRTMHPPEHFHARWAKRNHYRSASRSRIGHRACAGEIRAVHEPRDGNGPRDGNAPRASHIRRCGHALHGSGCPPNGGRCAKCAQLPHRRRWRRRESSR